MHGPALSLWRRKFGMDIWISILLTACSLRGAPTPTPHVLADSFFFGHAYVDANGNGQLDSTDPPLEDALFTAQTATGIQVGGVSGADGTAMGWCPGGCSDYPVTLRMQPPRDSSYTLIGPDKVVLETSASPSGADFLFAPPAGS